MIYVLDGAIRPYLARLHVLSDEDLERWTQYGSLEDRQSARDFAKTICSDLFEEEAIRPGKESRYILSPERLDQESLDQLTTFGNQVRYEIKVENGITSAKPTAENPHGQEKLWSHMVLLGLDGNKLRQCYEIVCRKLYLPDHTRTETQETCGTICSNRRAMRHFMPKYRKRKATKN